jgi:hypothetical protein
MVSFSDGTTATGRPNNFDFNQKLFGIFRDSKLLKVFDLDESFEAFQGNSKMLLTKTEKRCIPFIPRQLHQLCFEKWNLFWDTKKIFQILPIFSATSLKYSPPNCRIIKQYFSIQEKNNFWSEHENFVLMPQKTLEEIPKKTQVWKE